MAIAPLQLPGTQPFVGDLGLAQSLGQLGKVYEEGQLKRGMQEALANGSLNPNDPQSLSALAAKVLPYNQTMGLSLASLANTASNTQYQHGRDASNDAWRQQESARTQQNADRSYQLQERQANRLEETPEETAAQRAKAAKANGVDVTTPQGRAYVLTGKLPESDTTLLAAVEQRKSVAQGLGMTPEHPAYNSFIATGKMPREDAQPLTAGDKEAIRTADDAVISNRAAIDSLNRAKQLSKQAFSGPYADKRGYAASFLGESSDVGKSGIATENLTNEVGTNALGQLKAIFGGNPTEGERKILLDLQGSVSKPDAVRQEIYARAEAAARKRLEVNQQRADELRGNTYYKPKAAQPQAATATAAPASAQGGPGAVVDWQTYFGGGQ
jgi:hypothetical protein